MDDQKSSLDKSKLKKVETSEKSKNTPDPLTTKSTVLYGFGSLADQMSTQFFQFLVFTYYYAIVGVGVDLLAMGFVIFALWDSINDPMVGTLTDKTKPKMGRRKFWTIVSLVPFALVNVLLFTPPFFFGNTNIMINYVYMIIVIIVYDTMITFFGVSQLSLFSEMFITEEERGRANMWKCVLTIVGVIIGFVVPTLIIDELAPKPNTPPEVIAALPNQYFITSIMVAVLIIIGGLIFYKYGIVENRHDEKYLESQDDPGLFQMLTDTLKNKKFVLFCIANMVKWVVFKMLVTITPLWAIHNLGLSGIWVSVFLLIAFISSMIMFPIMELVGRKIGWRNGLIVMQLFWCIALVPYWWLDFRPYLAMVFVVFVGAGLSGAIYFVEPIIANVIDENELRTGRAKAGSYYGVNGLINRLSTIMVFVLIAIVLSGYGWEQYIVGAEIEELAQLREGLRVLFVPVSIAGNLIVAILLLFFPLHGERLEKVQAELAEVRSR